MRIPRVGFCAFFFFVFPAIGLCQGENPFSVGAGSDGDAKADVKSESNPNHSYSIKQGLALSYRNSRLNDIRNAKGVDSDLKELYADYSVGARLGEHSTAYIRGMANWTHHRESGLERESESDYVLIEGYYEFSDVENSVFYTVGRKKLYWSSGFQFRPADVLEEGRTDKKYDLIDPRQNRGWDIVQYQKLGEKFDFSLLVASAAEADRVHGVQYASRLEYHSFCELALFGAKNGDYSEKVGIAIDSAAPFSSTFRLEAVAIRVDEQQIYQPDSFGSTLESMSGASSYNEVLASFTHFFDERRRLNFEYFYNGSGFRSSSIPAEISRSVDRYLSRGYSDPTILEEVFQTQYLRRNYVSLSYSGYMDSLAVSFAPRAIIGTDDSSSIMSLVLSKELSGKVMIFFEGNWYEGRSQTEFGSVADGPGLSIALIINAF